MVSYLFSNINAMENFEYVFSYLVVDLCSKIFVVIKLYIHCLYFNNFFRAYVFISNNNNYYIKHKKAYLTFTDIAKESAISH